jgi:GTP cyclohydrolase I
MSEKDAGNGRRGCTGKGYSAESAVCTAEDLECTPKAHNPQMQACVRNMIELLGEDPNREGLVRTPLRVSKAMEFLTAGYGQSVEELLNGAVFEEQYDEIVSIKSIPFFSLCEHHMLPFFGIANIGYIPNGKVVGLSKIPRIVDMYARRLQVQERLTSEIAHCLHDALEPRGVAVVMEAYHLCMMMRGVEKQDCTTVTSCMLGDFRTSQQTRNEFITLCGSNSLKR